MSLCVAWQVLHVCCAQLATAACRRGHLIASPGDPVYDTAAKSAAERMKRERTYRSKVRNSCLSAAAARESGQCDAGHTRSQKSCQHTPRSHDGIDNSYFSICICVNTTRLTRCMRGCRVLPATLQARSILVSNWPAEGIPELMGGLRAFHASQQQRDLRHAGRAAPGLAHAHQQLPLQLRGRQAAHQRQGGL